ncbi:MAG: GH1 family beta-glucosidase [Fibrobacterota bacterium]
MSFPQNFIWGASTAAYQIEGAVDRDGRGPSVWDEFCRRPDAVVRGESGAHACNHYDHSRDDVALFKELGFGGYRFSLSWSRLLPQGTGRINRKGRDFYNRLIDDLCAAGITPCITLFHWDFPLELFYRGGWLNRDSASWFAEYAQKAAELFGDRVDCFITQNEPQCFIDLGHRTGYHAPGMRLAMDSVLRAAHHSLLAHGDAFAAMKAVRSDLQVGYGPVGVTSIPADSSGRTQEAARKAMFSHDDESLFTNTWFMDPVFFGTYPEDGLRFYADAAEGFIQDGDMERIGRGADFLGTNIYHGDYVGPDQEHVDFPAGSPRTAMGWQITPQALYWGPKFLWERYKTPLIITENGVAGIDIPDNRKVVRDPYRITYLSSYLRELKQACAEGVDVRGYFTWSAMDNFEWAEGYDKRFGMIYIDYATGERIPKESAYWYSRIIEQNGTNL